MTRGRSRAADARSTIRDALVVGGLLLYASPFFWQLLTSLKPEGDLLRLPPLLPSTLTLAHYRVVLAQSTLPRALVNSAGVAVLTTVLVAALSLPAAYALARLPVTGRRVILLGILGSTAFPQIATVSPLYLLFRSMGLRDTWTALVLAHTSLALPLGIWLLTGFVREIPRALEEAAGVDGAGPLRTLVWVVGPLTAPGIASVALLAFLGSWNEFLFAYTFTASERSRTVSVALALFPGVFEVPWGDIAAASILASVPTVLIVAGVQRHLIRGLTAGAIRE